MFKPPLILITIVWFAPLFVTVRASAQNAALVIIDMQPNFSQRYGYHTRPENQKKLEAILERQSELIRLAKAQNVPILVVEYRGEGQTSAQLMHEIGDYTNVKTFVKKTDGLFSDEKVAKNVREFLDEKKVSDLIVTGANGSACVHCSIHGAIQDGYGVWTDEKAIADFNSPDFIYPYHYSHGFAERGDKEKVHKINQLSHISNLDQILDVAREKNFDVKTESVRNCIKSKLKIYTKTLPF